MFLQTHVTTRRGFLERSALGAGSILLAPLLLEGCTDHIIPTPPTATPPPQLPSASLGELIYWYDPAKALLIAGLSLPPQPGGFLGALLTSLWPRDDQPFVWQLAMVQMQDAVGQQIDAGIFTNAVNALASIKESINDYLTEVKYGSPDQINDKWEDATDQFVASQHFFTASGYEVLLLPLFAQFATLYLALLRDGVAFGQSWGRSDDEHQQDIATLQGYIQGATNQHVNGWYTVGHTNVVNKTAKNDIWAEPFRSINKYERELALLVLDFRNTWPYFDVTKYPNGVNVDLTREIYSDPFGPNYNSDPIALPSSRPTQFPTQLSVWAGNLIYAVQLTYPAGSGPDSATQTSRMGIPNAGTNQSPGGAVLTLSSDNPITQFRVVSQPDGSKLSGPYVTAMQFQYHDGTTTNLLGGQALPSDYETVKSYLGGLIYEVTSWLGYGPYQALSSIYIAGSYRYDPDDIEYITGLVFGFTNWQSLQATLNTIVSLYVTSPQDHSAAYYANAFPQLGITDSLFTDEVKAARQKYWDQMRK